LLFGRMASHMMGLNAFRPPMAPRGWGWGLSPNLQSMFAQPHSSGFGWGGYGAGPAWGSLGGYGPSRRGGVGGFGSVGGYGGYTGAPTVFQTAAAPAVTYGGYGAYSGAGSYGTAGQEVVYADAGYGAYSSVAQPTVSYADGYSSAPYAEGYSSAPYASNTYESYAPVTYVQGSSAYVSEAAQDYGAQGYSYSTSEKLFGGESWYQGLEGPEQSFRGRLEAAPREEASYLQRTSFYRMNGRNLYTSGARHPVLENLVGQEVEITGKVYDAELEGTYIREIWPASVRSL